MGHICYNNIMKIAVFTDIYAPWGCGGIATALKTQKEELEKMGHEVVVFCPGKNSREKNVVNIPTCKFWKVNRTPLAQRPEKIEQFILKTVPNFADFDLVHVHYEAACSLAGVRLARRFGLPLIQTMHGREDMAIAVNVPHPWKSLVAHVLRKEHQKYIPYSVSVKRDRFQAVTRARANMWAIMVNQANQADIVITPSDHFARKLTHYGVIKPIKVVSNGVEDAITREKFPLRKLNEGDVLKIIWNSRTSREKRIMPFLKALTMMERPYLVCIYGEGNDFKKAQRYAKRHDLKVKFYGHRKQEKILERMRESHLGVMASYNFDTQGMTLLEAEATGLPVFFCDPVMTEIIPNGGYVLASGPEPEAMAITLNHLAPEKIAEMSAVMLANRKEVAQALQTKKLLKVYQKLINQRRVKPKVKTIQKTTAD